MPGLMTAAWAQACQDTINGWPDEARRASKLQDFWDWIGMVRPFVTGRLALSVRDMPAGADGDTLALDLEEGAVKAAAVLGRERGGRRSRVRAGRLLRGLAGHAGRLRRR